MPRRVVIRRWSPPREPITWTTSYVIENPARMAEIAAVKLARELARLGERYEAFAKMQFAPTNNDSERPLEEHQERVCADFVKAAERHIEGIMLARERAQGVIRVEEGEQLYRIRLGVVGVRGITLQPGEVIALRPEEAVELGDVIEPVGDTPVQEQVA